ncbi:MAG: hypothetical protein WDO73_00340 [Ignavibacteriota bacterium]
MTDSKHSIQSAVASLSKVDPRKIPRLREIEECLEDADKVLRQALQHSADTHNPTRDRARLFPISAKA